MGIVGLEGHNGPGEGEDRKVRQLDPRESDACKETVDQRFQIDGQDLRKGNDGSSFAFLNSFLKTRKRGRGAGSFFLSRDSVHCHCHHPSTVSRARSFPDFKGIIY